MAKGFDKEAKELKVFKNFLSFYAKHLEQLCAKEFELPRARQLDLLNETSGFIAALDSSRVKNPTPQLKKALQELNQTQGKIIDVLRERPVSVAAHGLIAKLANDSSEKIKAIEKHLEKVLEARLLKKSLDAAKDDNWRQHWDDKWLERRENGKGWKYSAADIQAQLARLRVTGIPDESVIRKKRLEKAK